jgi:hypothetical protein
MREALDVPIAQPEPAPEAAPAEVFPTEGGSYIRNPDGSLTCVVPPTIIPKE